MADLANLAKFLANCSLNDSNDDSLTNFTSTPDVPEEFTKEWTTPVKARPKMGNKAKAKGPRKISKQDDIVDLCASPTILPGVIVLDPGDDEPRNKGLSYEDMNYEMSIKIRWMNEIERHTLRRFEKFEILLKKIAERESANSENVILMMNDERILKPTDTPDSIGLRITHILSGRIVEGCENVKPKKPKQNKDMIKVKIQAEGLKRAIEIVIDRTKEFTAVHYAAAEALKTEPDKIKLKFDGDLIDPTETPTDLDFEGGEILDVIFKKV